MNQYTVYYRIIEEGQIDVEADSKEAAEVKVEKMSLAHARNEGSLDDDRLEVVDVYSPKED